MAGLHRVSVVKLDPCRRLLVPSPCLLPCAWPARQILTRAATRPSSPRGGCGRLGAVLYGTARSPEPHSAAALYSSYSGRRPTKLDGTPDMRYSANRAFAGPEFANDRQHARTKAFCDEHGLGHMWPQLQKIGVNTPADIAALRSADLYHLAQLPGSEGLGRTPAQPFQAFGHCK
jgi:hypothetical protein